MRMGRGWENAKRVKILSAREYDNVLYEDEVVLQDDEIVDPAHDGERMCFSCVFSTSVYCIYVCMDVCVKLCVLICVCINV